MTTKVSRKDLEKVLAALIAQIPWAADKVHGPFISEHWDWGVYDGPAIVWEDGPYGWVYLFPHGGTDEEFGVRRPDVSDQLPAGIYIEAINDWALSVAPG